MRKAVAVLLAFCFIVPISFATSRDETLTLEERFEISVKPGVTFDILTDGLDFKTEFTNDPEGFLSALSKQTKKVQNKVVFLLVYQCKFWYGGREELEKGLDSVSGSKNNGANRLVTLINAELIRTKPDYRDLFTRITDGHFSESLGGELRIAFEYDQYAFIARLSLYNVKWQLMVCGLMTGEYVMAEDLPVLQDEIETLRKDKRKKTFLFHITLDNVKNAIEEHIARNS